jgi:hypothetical protein
MERGHAFAKAMETLGKPAAFSVPAVSRDDWQSQPRLGFDGATTATVLAPALPSSDLLVAEGHAFAFTCNAEIEAWPRRELKAEKDYGGIIVSARCDRLHGKIIADDKSTSHFSGDAGVEKYIDKWQPRFYMDIFGATSFVWHVWETRQIDIREPKDYPGVRVAWEVFAHHVFTMPCYPAMEDDCRNFALEYKAFAEVQGL